MRKYVLNLCTCMILCFLICLYPVFTQASEITADELSAAFYQYVYDSDGAAAEGHTYDLGEYFFVDPVAFVRQLALEPEDIRMCVVNNFPRSMYHGMHPKGFHEFPNTVYSIKLADDDTAETRNIVTALEAGITKYWGISNPHTGDPIGIAALLMAASGLGTALLWKRRKTVV